MNDKLDSKLTEISKEEIAEDLKRIGIREGDHLCVALSFRSVGRVRGGPDSFIDAILEVIGPTGTLMMNTYTQFCFITELRAGRLIPIFHYESTPSLTGIVPEAFRNRPGAIRSRHPMSSITAFGNQANYLTDGHDETASPYAPYSRLGDIGGKVLYIGLGDRLVSLRHEAQNLAGLMNVVPLEVGIFYINELGETRLFTAKNVFACAKRLPKLVPYLRNMGLITEGKIGNAASILVPAKETLNAMADLLRENPTLNLCEDLSCIWCRELERRLGLYDKIESPTIFQKNALIIKSIAAINKYRLNGHRKDVWLAYKAIAFRDRIFSQ
jgi:aminoglycoside 3-N-acetyltransferase